MKKRHTAAMVTPLEKLAMAMAPFRRVLRVVLHHLPGAASAGLVQLEEDNVLGPGDTQLVVVHQILHDERVKDGEEVFHQVGIVVLTDALEHDVRSVQGGWGVDK